MSIKPRTGPWVCMFCRSNNHDHCPRAVYLDIQRCACGECTPPPAVEDHGDRFGDRFGDQSSSDVVSDGAQS